MQTNAKFGASVQIADLDVGAYELVEQHRRVAASLFKVELFRVDLFGDLFDTVADSDLEIDFVAVLQLWQVEDAF